MICERCAFSSSHNGLGLSCITARKEFGLYAGPCSTACEPPLEYDPELTLDELLSLSDRDVMGFGHTAIDRPCVSCKYGGLMDCPSGLPYCGGSNGNWKWEPKED